MIKLQRPNFGAEQVVPKLIEGITGNPKLRHAVQSEHETFNHWEALYEANLDNQSLFSCTPDAHNFTDLSQDDVKKLYPQYFVDKSKPARILYDSIMNSANGRCPFCGGVGAPGNLDHYLPKQRFTQFSVLPLNLVPACRDCNMGAKGQDLAITADQQPLHPYENLSHFYSEQWIFADYEPDPNGEPGRIVYRAAPPETWNETDKSRARNHFHNFNLSSRYSTKAAEELPIKILEYEKLKNLGLSPNNIKMAIFDFPVQEAHFINHWRYVMFKALFEHDFGD